MRIFLDLQKSEVLAGQSHPGESQVQLIQPPWIIEVGVSRYTEIPAGLTEEFCRVIGEAERGRPLSDGTTRYPIAPFKAIPRLKPFISKQLEALEEGAHDEVIRIEVLCGGPGTPEAYRLGASCEHYIHQIIKSVCRRRRVAVSQAFQKIHEWGEPLIYEAGILLSSGLRTSLGSLWAHIGINAQMRYLDLARAYSEDLWYRENQSNLIISPNQGDVILSIAAHWWKKNEARVVRECRSLSKQASEAASSAPVSNKPKGPGRPEGRLGKGIGSPAEEERIADRFWKGLKEGSWSSYKLAAPHFKKKTPHGLKPLTNLELRRLVGRIRKRRARAAELRRESAGKNS